MEGVPVPGYGIPPEADPSNADADTHSDAIEAAIDRVADDQAAIDADLERVKIVGSVRAAGGVHTLAGLLTFLGGIQVAGTVQFARETVSWIPFAFMATGLVALICGTLTYRAKAIGAIVAAVLSGVHVLGGGVWFVTLLGWGIGSLPVMLTPAVSMVAFGLGAYALPKVMRIDAARRRLAASGLSFGV